MPFTCLIYPTLKALKKESLKRCSNLSTYINIRSIRVISGQKNEFESAYSQSLRRERKKKNSAPLRSKELGTLIGEMQAAHSSTLQSVASLLPPTLLKTLVARNL